MDPDRHPIAEYFNVDPEIAHLVPRLLADFDARGSYPSLLVELLAQAGLERGARLLDLGCGKGAVAIAAARALEARVDGVDLLPAFVEQARARAEAAGVAGRCHFEVGDLRQSLTLPGRPAGYDAALLVSVGEVLGPLGQAVGAMRRVVRPGGLLVVDDGYLLGDTAPDLAGYGQSLTREQALAQLTSHGDPIVVEQPVTAAQVAGQNAQYNRWIGARAEQLAREFPQHAAALQAYVERELEESRMLETDFACVTWILRRA